VPEGDDFALSVFGPAPADAGTVVAAARTVGMFAPRRVVLVRDAGALDGDPGPIADYAAHPPAGSYLLVVAPALDRRKKMQQTLATAGKQVAFETPDDPRHLAAEVAAIGRTCGLEVDSRAAMILAEACGGDLLRAESELEKIRTWRGEGGPVRTRDLSEIAAGSAVISGWEIADAVLQRSEADAILGVRRALAAGDEPLKILGGLAFRARAMLRAKALVERGVPLQRAFGEARLFGGSFDRRRAGLARFRLDELARFPIHLSAADRTIKSRAIDPGAVLESLVRRMTSPEAAP
jgi:DNA polymerase-3 subunit delta